MNENRDNFRKINYHYFSDINFQERLRIGIQLKLIDDKEDYHLSGMELCSKIIKRADKKGLLDTLYILVKVLRLK